MFATTFIPMIVWAHLAVFHAASAQCHLDVAKQSTPDRSLEDHVLDGGLFDTYTEWRGDFHYWKSPSPRHLAATDVIHDVSPSTYWHRSDVPTPDVEKVVIRDTTLSEKCGLDVEPAAKPDAEIAALQADATKFTSGIDLRANAKGPSWETPTMHRDRQYKMQWDKRFTVSWDGDGGYRFGERYFCMPETDYSQAKIFSFVGSFHR